MNEATGLERKRVLVVEDDYAIALSIVEWLEAAGAKVVGPSGTIEDASRAWRATEIDAAVLDINLRGHMSYDFVDALREEGVPVVFATGYHPFVIPRAYADVPLCSKPVRSDALVEMLSSVFAPAAAPKARRCMSSGTP